MPTETREVRPSSKTRTVLSSEGQVLAVPDNWSLLSPGDPALSRRIKQDGPSWTMIETKGRKRFSRGVWAPTERIEALRAELLFERRSPSYQRKLDAGRKRRAAKQAEYADTFFDAVFKFLAFAPRYATQAKITAQHIADRAVPVGSGTVARTERIPIDQRAEAATIAWMRHQTTGYDNMAIPLVKGRRREIRRLLAQRSVQLLFQYRQGLEIETASCPLAQALQRLSPEASAAQPPEKQPVQSSFF